MTWNDGALGRFNRLQNWIDRLDIDLALISDPKNVYYFTGYADTSAVPVPAYLLAFKGDEPILLTGITRTSTAEKTYGGQIATFVNYSLQERMLAYPDLVAKEAKKIISAKKPRFRKVGLELWALPETLHQAITEATSATQCVDLSGKILTMRMMKDPDEIKAIRKGCELNDFAYGVAKQAAFEGRTELEVYAVTYQELIKKASSSSFQFFYGDFASGERSLQGGGPPTSRVLKRGDTFILDLWITTKGYWADTCRTFLIGNHPNSRQKGILETLKGALSAGADKLRPGFTARDVYKAVFDVIKKAGHGDRFPHHGGHCMGLDAWEPPFIIPGSNEALKEGMVCGLEPGVYIPGIGGMRIENDYLVKARGAESLSRFPLDL